MWNHKTSDLIRFSTNVTNAIIRVFQAITLGLL